MPSSLGPSDGPATNHQQEIVTFVEDGEVAMDLISPSRPVPTYLDAEDMQVNSVVSFLKRPILFANELWNTTDVAGTTLNNCRLPRNWINNPMIREKLSGFRFLKCDFKVKVQVNAMPFQAGRLLMYFNPAYSQQTVDPSSISHFGGITGYPHVELDLMNETAMEITVPFNNLLSHFDLVRGQGTAGSVFVKVYSALTGDAASTADVSVWMWADNIDLQLPTGMPLAPGNPADNSQSVVEKRRPGNVETISKKVGSIARTLTQHVPLLSAITTPISAVSDAVAGISSLFGFSKPQDPEFPIKAELGYAKHYTNFNGDVKAKVIALDARNQVEIPSYTSYTDADELALQTLIQKFTYLGRFTWNTTDVTDTIVFNVPNVPDYCITSATIWPTGDYDALFSYHTLLSYLSGMFAFWRGSLKYKFKIVKTPFHTGRLRVDLVPGYTGTGDYVREKVYSQIVDIRETNEFEIEVPYKWNAPWKRLTIDPLTDKYSLTPTSLFVRVLNPLRNGGQSATKVELLVEVAGGTDFQFAYPLMKDGICPLNSTFPMAAQPDNSQSGEVISSHKGGFEANSIGIGEVVTSLRQVLKRYIPFRGTGIVDGPVQGLLPFSTTHESADGLDIAQPLVHAPVFDHHPDFYSYISYLFRFRSGSVRVAALTGSLDDLTPIRYAIGNQALIPTSVIFPPPTYAPVFDLDGVPTAYQFKMNEPFAEFQVPFYQLWPAILTPLGLPSQESSAGLTIGDFTSIPYNDGTSFVTYGMDPAEFAKMQFSRAIGEDFNFSFAVGPPITVQAVIKA